MHLVIGGTGYLGQYLCNEFTSTNATHRFEDSVSDWIDSYEGVDYVWLTARTCRKKQPRRDYKTFVNEVAGVNKICRAFPHAHIVYTSTKVVYGITDNEIKPVSRQDLGKYFINAGLYKNKIINVPECSRNNNIHISTLGEDHKWYAITKLACEQIVAQQTHTILRIWDIA